MPLQLLHTRTMVENKNKSKDKLTDAEKKKIKQANKAKANPTLAAEKKGKQDAKRDRRGMKQPDAD